MPTAKADVRTTPTCFFSVVRYVADPIRDEARNIGVLVVSSDASYAGAKFNLSKLHLPAGSDRLRYLRDLTGSYQRRLPAETIDDASLTNRGFLEDLHRQATNVIQFSAPSVALGTPQAILEAVYRERVAEPGGGGGMFGRSEVVSAISRSMRSAGVAPDSVVPSPWVGAGADNYVFDVGVKNGAWVSVLQVLSFRKQDTLRVEHDGAWFARAFPVVRTEHGVSGHVFFERPTAGGEAARRFDRVRKWVEAAGASTHEPETVDAVAGELAREVAGHGDSKKSLTPTP